MRSLRELEVFSAVVECGSLTRAARSVGISVPSVSKCITELEADLGVALLLRTTHKITLTDAGSLFYERCAGILASLDDAKSEVAQSSQHMTGRIRVHSGLCVGQTLVAPCLARFIEANPSVAIFLILTPGPIQMSRFDLDLIIKSGTPANEVGHKQRVLAHLPYVVCASPSYLARSPRIRSARDLAVHNCLIHTTQEEPNLWSIAEDHSEVRVCVRSNFTSNASLAVRSAALAGVGIARLPTYMVASEIRSGSLVSLFPGRVLSHRVVSAFYPRSSRPPRKIATLLDFMAANIALPDAFDLPDLSPGVCAESLDIEREDRAPQ